MTTETKPASRKEANRRLYGGPAEGAKAAAPAASRKDAAKLMYGGPSADSGSHDGALTTYYSRRDARLRAREDTEGLQLSWREQQQMAEFARKHNIAPADLQEALSVVNEHEAFPKSPQVIEQRWGQMWEELRLECGGQENREKLMNNYVNLTKALVQEVPTLADRAGRSGAANDLRIIRTLAKYGEPQPAVKE
jgi:hypothetical protein